MAQEIASTNIIRHDCKTPKKNSMIMEGEKLLDKINILTMKTENHPKNAKLPTIKDFAIIKPISRGAFGKVFLGYKNNDPEKLYAIKVMRKSDMINKNMVSQVITERNALALSRSPFCVSLFYSLQSLSYVYLVMEYMIGGDLKSLLAMYGYFDEAAARFYVAEVALALQYLHSHGIVHRDIKPDNMLISGSGHVKLTDFGLSKIELRRDLEISDLINCSPNLNARTPGQLLSLTSHLSFGSEKKSHLISIINKQNMISESSDSEADTSLNDAEKKNESKISGVSPFYSAEELNVSMSIVHTCNQKQMVDSSSCSSYHTCTSGEMSKDTSPARNGQGTTASAQNANANDTPCGNATKMRLTNRRVEFCENNSGEIQCDGCKYVDMPVFDKHSNYNNNENLLRAENAHDDTSFDFSMRIRTSKGQEDSGVSSRKSDSSHINGEIMTSMSMDKVDGLSNSKDEFNSSDYSRSYNINNTNESSDIRMHSPFRNYSRNFKRPEFLRNSFSNLKRKVNVMNRSENVSTLDADGCNSASTTGLTQEIDILDIGSSTPKKRKAKSPIRGVLKVRSLSDDEMPQMIGENVTNVVFSTPVSSQKVARLTCGLLGKLKATRFALPSSIDLRKTENCVEKTNTAVQYLKSVSDDPTMSPIDVAGSAPKTPKNVNTPFRTPKSVRRGTVRASTERILGTPDYLAPELLMRQGHGPTVDWWALGVCLYEFMTGIPPFNDETPLKVFDNILNRNIEWPEGNEALSPEAVEAVDMLLTMDPQKRPAAKEVQRMRFFADIRWEKLIHEEPPFVPSPDNPTDTAYFEARNNLQHLKLSNFVQEE